MGDRRDPGDRQHRPGRKRDVRNADQARAWPNRRVEGRQHLVAVTAPADVDHVELDAQPVADRVQRAQPAAVLE